MIKHFIYKITSIVCVVLLVNSCKHGESDYHSVTDRIEAESKNYDGTTINSGKHMDHIKTVEITENGITFLIPDRKGEIKSYSCTECHSKPLEQMKTKDLKKAHWNIRLDHANKETMNCITCHDGNNMDYLNSLTGAKMDFNKSYQLCSQCHQKQFKDWTGGAHGKRIESWTPPRVSMTCVNCHNPHSPSFETKWPERYNTQKIKERK